MDRDLQEFSGLYRHYKGNKYQVIGVGLHTETEEKLIIYKSFHEPQLIWARPFDMFFDTVIVNGKKVQRFEKLEDK